MNILYIGGFLLPDKNAAAQRVINNAKALRDMGHNVVFINEPKGEACERWVDYFGFPCYEQKRPSQYVYLTSVSRMEKIIKEKKIDAVIAYNHPSVALNRLIQYCKKNNLKCYSDATEWYVGQRNPVFNLIKNADSNYRMKSVHFKLDGVIAISKYLYDYYKDRVATVKVPPLVDINDSKWGAGEKNQTELVRFVFAGTPSMQKERLDFIVSAVEAAAQNHSVQLDVVGLTHEQYMQIYHTSYNSNIVKFHGRVSHKEALDYVKEADWSIVIRDNNLVVTAGFPTKVAESISAGTPVIANRFSNIDDYLDESNSILMDNVSELSSAIENAVHLRLKVRNDLFDYRNYIREFEKLF